MGSVRVISSERVEAAESEEWKSKVKIIELTAWDLEPLPLEMNQKGLLFRNTLSASQINHLKNTLSATLSFFPPLAGRLLITQSHTHTHTHTSTAQILCNNAGALFVHALASDCTVAHITRSHYVPPLLLRSFFPLNGINNFQGTSHPLLAIQITQLADGLFMGFTVNHAVADGHSLWSFVNSWSQISRSSSPSKAPSSLQRFFLHDGVKVDPPIHFPTITLPKDPNQTNQAPPVVRVFHFTRDQIATLKNRANTEANTNNKISSLQALLTHLWRSVVRCHGFHPEEEVFYFLAIGVRQRMVPPLPENYFGNALQVGVVRMKAGELVDEQGGGLGKGALEMNKVVASHDGDRVRAHYLSMSRNPVLLSPTTGRCGGGKGLATGSSPRFDVYGNDFGWGKPVAVRDGGNNKNEGMVTVFCGEEEGSVDLQVCLPFQILEAMANDPLFILDH